MEKDNLYIEVINSQKLRIDELIKREKKNSGRIVACRIHDENEDSNIFYCGATRFWTSTCVNNLYCNINLKWSAAQTAKETNRDVQEIIFMTAFLKIYGYDEIYVGLLRKELNFDISKEIRFLQKLGVIS